MRGISLSTFRRLLAIVREHYGICREDGNSYQDTPANRKYLALLALYERLEDGVDMQAFCTEFHIGRTSFFRYLTLVEDFYFYLYEGAKRIALLGDALIFAEIAVCIVFYRKKRTKLDLCLSAQ